jgi:S-adenosylmethionine hydrolase
MIFLFTDFGSSDIYVGQVKAVLLASMPAVPIIDLLHDIPNHNVESGAHLLSALTEFLPESATVMAVIDPGVGSSRRPVVMQADGRWYVGPDNGLLSVVAARAIQSRVWEIAWRPEHLSDSFHGRDLFAPVVAMLENNERQAGAFKETERLRVQLDENDLEQVIYVDHYGNAMTGLRAERVPKSAMLVANGRHLAYARTFSDVPPGVPFWTSNSLGLVEIALNGERADACLGLSAGCPVQLLNAAD